LGPGDELQVSVFGIQEFSASIPVSVEGKVSIQNVGQISVSGMTIEAATKNQRSYSEYIVQFLLGNRK
jgi:protein involved in polysaccharide export with SLBB domain